MSEALAAVLMSLALAGVSIYAGQRITKLSDHLEQKQAALDAANSSIADMQSRIAKLSAARAAAEAEMSKETSRIAGATGECIDKPLPAGLLDETGGSK